MRARSLSRYIHRPGPGLPPLPGPPRGDRACRAALEHLLLNTILPVWVPGVIDHRHGGYHLNNDARGRRLEAAPRRLITQARTLWFFSELAGSPYGTEEHTWAARHGFAYLRDVMQDGRDGGFWFEVGPLGEVTSREKHLYAHSFVLYALSAFARLTGDQQPGAMARELFARIESHRDHVNGGYEEAFAANWRPLGRDETSAMGTPAGLRTLNTHLHLLEAFAEYVRLTGDSLAVERTRELTGILGRRFWKGDGCVELAAPDWTPVPTARGLRVSYGHDVEVAWLMLDAADATGDAEAVLPMAAAITRTALKWGLAVRKGGVYDGGELGKPADERSRRWWVQAETLSATLEIARRTDDAAMRDTFERALAWVLYRQVDSRHGGWHDTVLPDGRVYGQKASAWKCPYHEGRAMLRCLRLLGDPAG